jgi:hypothetical protein
MPRPSLRTKCTPFARDACGFWQTLGSRPSVRRALKPKTSHMRRLVAELLQELDGL